MSNHYLPELSPPAQRWARFLGVLLGTAVVLWLCWRLRGVFAPVAAAWALAYMLNPLINRLEGWKIPRLHSVACIVLLLGLLILGCVLIGAMQAISFAHNVPRYLDHVRQWLDQRFPDLLGEDQHQRLLDFAGERGSAIGGALVGYMLAIFTNVTHWLTLLILIPLYLFFLSMRFNEIVAWMRNHLPYDSRAVILEIGRTIDLAIANFFRGRVIVCAVLGGLCAIGWTILGVPNSLLLGALLGVLSIVPFGALVVVPFALIFAYTHVPVGVDWKLPVILTMGVYMLAQAAESFVLAPLILAHTSGLHPVTTVVALLVGHELFGVLGLLLAIPVASTLITLAQRYVMPEIRRLAAGPRHGDPPGDAAGGVPE